MDEKGKSIPNPYENVNLVSNPISSQTPNLTNTASPATGGASQNTRTIVTILLLIFVFPIGFLLMWFWSKWKVWVKVLVSVPAILATLLVIPATLLVAINPAKQFSLANNVKRASDVSTILNSIQQYGADNKGDFKPLGLPDVGEPGELISSSNGYAKFCSALVPEYLSALPIDPSDKDSNPVEPTDCTGTWDTKYMIAQETDGSITVSAPATEADAPIISVSR